MTKAAVVRALARSMQAAGTSVDEIAAQAALTLGQDGRWLRGMARRYLSAQGAMRWRYRDVVRFLLEDRGYRKHSRRLKVAAWLHEIPSMQPVAAAAGWGLPEIVTAGDLARWLGVHPGELEWFANLKGLGTGRLSHYHYIVVDKGGGQVRMIEAPKRQLKELQRWILREILDKIPVHPAVHGFVRGRFDCDVCCAAYR